MISSAELHSRFSYDPLTGENDFPRKIDGVPIKPERLAWLWVYGDWPKRELCFADGDSSNLRIGNLVGRTYKGSRRPGPDGRVDYVSQAANRASKTGVAGVTPTTSGRFRSTATGRAFDNVGEARADYIAAYRASVEKRLHRAD